MNFSIVNSLDEATWKAFLESQACSNIFHTPEMFRVWAQTKGCSPQLWAALDSSKQPLALFTPVKVTLMGGPLIRLTTRSIAYGSVLCAPGEAGKEALGALLNSYCAGSGRFALFTELRNLYDLSEAQPVLEDHGFVYEDHLNYLVDLDLDKNQVFENIGARTRKNIRRALRNGDMIVDVMDDPHLLPVWYTLLSKTYQAARVPLADFSLFEAAYNILQPLGMINFWLVRIGKVYVAASAEMGYKDTLYGWYGAVDRAYAPEYPGELLMWRVLEWAVDKGYKVYDFGGAGKPGEANGIRDFKAKFGGKLVCYGRNTWVPDSTLLGASKMGYEVYRKLKLIKRKGFWDKQSGD